MAHKNEALAGLETLIAQARRKLTKNPDYIVLRALEKARDEIIGEGQVVIDDSSGEVLRLVPTGEVQPKAPSQLDAAIMALNRAGHPLTTVQMIERVRALGARVGGKNPALNLGSTLSRAENIASVRYHGQPGWWFRGKPVPNDLGEAAE